MLAYPILWREILDLSRRRKLWQFQMLYAAVLGIAFLLLWPRGGRLNPAVLQDSGAAFLTWVLWLQIGLLAVFVPPLIAASLAIERDQGSLDVLLLSPLGAGPIVVTKCFSHLFKFALVFLAGVPIFVLGLFLGGVGPRQVYLSLFVLFGVGLLCGSVGALSGAWFRSVFMAIVGSYVLTGLLLGLIPILISLVWGPAWYLLSPFGMVSLVLGEVRGASEGGLVGSSIHLGAWAGLSVVFLLAARRGIARGTDRKGSPAFLSRTLRRSQVGAKRTLNVPFSELLVWREKRGKRPDCTWLPFLLLLTMFGALVALNLMLWSVIRDPQMILAATLGLLLAVLILMLLVSTASVVQERRKGDWELLLLSDLGGREMIRGKYRGLMATLRPILVLPLVQAALWPWPWALIPMMIVALVLYALAPATILAGIESGMRHDDLRSALSRSGQRWAALLLVISAKMIFILCFPVVLLLVFPVFGIVALVFVYPFVRYANDYLLGPVIDDFLSVQLSQSGMDVEQHKAQWEIGRLEKALAAVLWLIVGIFVSVYSGRLIGVFVLFVLGTGVAVAAMFGAVWLFRKWQARFTPHARVEGVSR